MAVSHEHLIFLGGTQIWLMKLLALFLGYKVVVLGAGLLREGVSGEFKFQSEFQGFKADLASASPGLLFVLIGGLIILYAMFVDKKVDYGSQDETTVESTSNVREVPHERAPPDVDLIPAPEETGQ